MRATTVFASVLGLLMLFTSAVTAKADVIYNYTGNPLTSCGGPGCVASAPFPEITASFALLGSPLGSSFSGAITPSSYEINDGTNILNNTNSTLSPVSYYAPGSLNVTTNGSGAITQWDFGAFGGFSSGFDYPYTYNESNGAEDAGGRNANSGSPGTWTVGGIAGQGTEVYYAFTWGEEGPFDASLSLLQNLENESYEFTMGTPNAAQCTMEAEVQIDALHDYTGSLTSPDLPAGTYCIGFNPLTGNIDPTFTLTFNTPVEGLTTLTSSTPEPSSFVLSLLGGLVMIAGLPFTKRGRQDPDLTVNFEPDI